MRKELKELIKSRITGINSIDREIELTCEDDRDGILLINPWGKTDRILSETTVINGIKNGNIISLSPTSTIYVCKNINALEGEDERIRSLSTQFEDTCKRLQTSEEDTLEYPYVLPTYKKTYTTYHVYYNYDINENHYYLQKRGLIHPDTLCRINKELFEKAKENNVFIMVKDNYEEEQELCYITVTIMKSSKVEELFGIKLEKGFDLERNATDKREKEYIASLNMLIKKYIDNYRLVTERSDENSLLQDAYMGLMAINESFPDIPNKEELLRELDFHIDEKNFILTIGNNSTQYKKSNT